MIDLDRIEADAKVAIEGPWCALHNNGEVAGVTLLNYPDTQHDVCACETPGRQDAGHNATHIANCDPQTVLAMVAAIRAAQDVESRIEGRGFGLLRRSHESELGGPNAAARLRDALASFTQTEGASS